MFHKVLDVLSELCREEAHTLEQKVWTAYYKFDSK